MSRVIKAFEQFFDSAGDPIQNGWLEFLFSGTNNSPKDTFADAEHNVLNPNPVQLDAAGRCPNVFGVGVYRVVLYENNPITNLPGVQIQSFDPVQAEGYVSGSGDDFEEWDSTIVYEIGNIVKVGEDYYKSYTTANFNNYPPSNADKWEQIDFIRYWNANVSYEIDDIVILDGVIYTSLQDSNINNDPPTSPLYWSAIGAGTTLLNWTEDGTTFRPVISGYDLGEIGNYLGDIFHQGNFYHNSIFNLYTATVLALTIDASQIATFVNFPIGPSSAPTTDYQFANKKYVDDEINTVSATVAIQNVSFNNLASPPSTPILNDLWYVSDNRYLKMYNGSGWLDVKTEIYFNNLASPPTGALNDIWFVSDTGQLKFHNGSTWLATVGEATRYRHEETATEGQTAFSTAFAISNESVYINGVLLETTEYTIGSSLITLDAGAHAGDVISIVSITVPPAVTLTDYVLKVGDTMTGNLIVNANIGIGVSSPLAELHIDGDMIVDNIDLTGTGRIVKPDTNNTGSLGDATHYFLNGYIQNLDLTGTLDVDGAAGFNAQVSFDDIIVMYADPRIYPSTSGLGSIGTTSNRFGYGYFTNADISASLIFPTSSYTTLSNTASNTFTIAMNDGGPRYVYFNNSIGDLNIWIKTNCSALSFTDRSKVYMGDDAIELIENIKPFPGVIDNDGWAELDHETLPKGVRKKINNEDGRDIGQQLQILTRAFQLLKRNVDKIDKKIK